MRERVAELREASVAQQFRLDGRRKVTLNPTEKSYQRLLTDNGDLLVMFDGMEPYLDGFRVTLQIGNPSAMDYNGFEATAVWGPPQSDFFGTNAPSADAYNKWESAQRTNTVKLTDKLLSGNWNYVRIIVAPAKPEELRNLALSIKTSQVSLGVGQKPKD